MHKKEDREICRECGGYCCINCGCDYFVSDIESFKIDALDNFLSSGYVSIIATLEFKTLPNGVLSVFPLLYLRERNINRDVVDLLSMKTTCASLLEDGCRYDLDNRPSGGATLIPKPDFECVSSVDRKQELLKWKPYQKTLERLVKRYTGLSVAAKLKEDVENLFLDVLNSNFENVSLKEKVDILKMLPLLQQAYPLEYKNAKDKHAKQSKKLLVEVK